MLINYVEHTWLSKTNADLIVVASGDKLKAHSLILAARSQVFEAMFSKNTKEMLDHVERNVIEHLLEYFYLGRVCFDDVDVLSLLVAADKVFGRGLKNRVFELHPLSSARDC